MPNTNCLEGIRCPECGFEEYFYISGFCSLTVFDDGIVDTQNCDWDGDCDMTCGNPACDWTGQVKDAAQTEDAVVAVGRR